MFLIFNCDTGAILCQDKRWRNSSASVTDFAHYQRFGNAVKRIKSLENAQIAEIPNGYFVNREGQVSEDETTWRPVANYVVPCKRVGFCCCKPIFSCINKVQLLG